MSNDLVQVEERRRSLLAAKVNLEEARVEAAKHANVFAKDGEDKIKFACQQAQLMSSRRWYNFWEKATKVPKTLALSDGETLEWSKAADRALKEVALAAAAEADGFDPAYAKGGAQVQYASRRTDNGVPLLRATKELGVAPRVVLLTQIRAAQAGAADSSLLYMREHYAFRGGRTALFHVVKSMGSSLVAHRDYVELRTWQEDPETGVITLAVKSVENSLARGIVPGAVRAQRLTFGMQIRPKVIVKKSLFGGRAEVDGCEVTVVSNTALRGFMPAFMQKSYALSEALAFLGGLEAAGAALEKDGLALELVNKYVENADEDDDEGARAAEGAAAAEAEAEAEAAAAAALGIDVEKEVGPIKLEKKQPEQEPSEEENEEA